MKKTFYSLLGAAIVIATPACIKKTSSLDTITSKERPSYVLNVTPGNADFDLNRDGNFSLLELELMADPFARYVFRFADDKSLAFDMLTQLPTGKVSRILRSMYDPEIMQDYFLRLSEQDLERAVEIVFNVRKGLYDTNQYRVEGRAAFSLLEGNPLRDKILIEVRKKDPVYYDSIIKNGTSEREIIDGSIMTPVLSFEEEPKPTFSRERKFLEDDPSAIQVFQHEYAITTAQSLMPVLQSPLASTCVIVTLYDPNAGVGAISHIDSITRIPTSFDRILLELDTLRGSRTNRLEARVIGGEKGLSEEYVYKINRRLEEKEGLEFVEIDYLHYFTIGGSASIQMDTRTGEVFDYEEENLEKFNEKREKLGEILNKQTVLSKHEDSAEVNFE
jgi:chemotaxis receptor (MCP) glutamine deamidase CheD